MAQKNITKSLQGMQKTPHEIKDWIKKALKKEEATHTLRVFFKKLRAYGGLMSVLGGKDVELTDTLKEFYQQLGALRDADIFYDLCKKEAKGNEHLIAFARKHKDIVQEKTKEYKKIIKIKKLARHIDEIIDEMKNRVDGIDEDVLFQGVKTHIERTENLIRQLLYSDSVTDVGLHTVRKQMKRVMYLLPYLIHTDKEHYKPMHKVYTQFAKKLGKRNDINVLRQELQTMPRRGKEEKIMHKIMHHEHGLKQLIVKKLKTYFVLLPNDELTKTLWVPTPQSGTSKVSSDSQPITPKKKVSVTNPSPSTTSLKKTTPSPRKPKGK